MSPFKYYLSHSDKQAKDWHSSTVHGGLESNLIEFVSIDAVDAKEAMNAYVNACKTNDQHDEQLEKASGKLCDLEGEVSQEPTIEKYFDVRSSDSLEQTTSEIPITNTLKNKLNTVIDMLNKLSSRMEKPKAVDVPDLSTMLQEKLMDKINLDGNVDWSKIENIIDLTTKVPTTKNQGEKG